MQQAQCEKGNYGTTLRLYNPATRTWEIAYGYTGRIMRFEARKQEDRIVLSSLEDEHRKWVFAEIAENHFHWQDIMVQQDGDRKSTRLNSSHIQKSRMPSSA